MQITDRMIVLFVSITDDVSILVNRIIHQRFIMVFSRLAMVLEVAVVEAAVVIVAVWTRR